jgi:UDP-GlcNAc:undecaprenyl-phosphate GlcNAc-1-phosphate transferase
MQSLLYLAGLSFTICFLLTPLVRNLMHRVGVLDHPDDKRKVHPRPIPRLGGVPIALAMAASLAIFSIAPLPGSDIFPEVLRQILPLLPAAAFVFVLGLLDDLFDLRPWQKLTGQVIAASWIYFHGFRINSVAGIPFGESHWIMYPLTVGWLLACTNAFNLIDGVDGLASGVGLFATATMLISALLHGNMELLILTVPLAAALLAFLRFNFNPASIFLGDSGSLLIGFLLGAYSLVWSYKSATILGMTAPVLALSFPIVETVISVARRFLLGTPIFGADRGHIHNRLLEMGLGPKQVAVLVYGIAGLTAGVALLMSVPGAREKGIVLILFCLFSWIGIQNLGYTEFGSARRIILGGTMRKLVAADVRLRAFARDLDQAASLNECWTLTVAALRDLGFDQISLNLPADESHAPLHWREVLHAGRYELRPEDCWTLKISLPSGRNGYLEISRHLDRGEGYLVIHPIVETVRRVFPQHIQRHRERLLLSLERARRAASRGRAVTARSAGARA